MFWSVGSVATAGQEVSDIEAAVAALAQSITRIEARSVTHPWLSRDGETMAARMRKDGQAALNAERSWNSTVGDIYVSLHPSGT